MSIQLQLRKGNTTQHSTFTGAIAEITVDTTKKTVVVHDGATAGGFPLALKSDVSNVNSNVATLTTSNIAESSNLYYTNNRVYSNVIQLGYITASSLSGYATNSQLSVYATVANVNLKANIADLTTTNVTELTNLYFTNSRVYSNVIELGYATTSYVNNEFANLINSAPAALDTLRELAEALGNDASFATTITNSLATKANTSSLTTANVVELTNLYYTNARVYSNVIELGYITSSSLSGYATNAQLTGYATNNQLTSYALATDLTTANVVELTNLYFTNSRVYSNVTQLGYATTGYVDGAVANLVNSAPATLDTLRELADALGNDASFATTVTNSIALKANTSSLTTANVVELTNLYYTNARVYSNVIPLLNTKANITDLTTSNVVERTNQYFTNARAILAAIPAVTQLTVTTPVFNYNIDQYSGDNPTIYVTAGETICFNLNIGSSHPLNIRVSNGGSNYNTGLTHISTDGTITTGSSAQGKVTGKLFWKVPFEIAGNTYVYQCSNHASMVGSIVILSRTLSTSFLAEGANLYYTNARVYANVIELGYITSSSLTGYATNSQLQVYATNSQLSDYATNNNVALKANVTDLTTSNIVEVGSLYFTNTRARQAITAANGINYNNSTGLLTSGLQLQLVDTSNVATTIVANVNTIQFDADSGFDVVDQANGIAKVQMNSTFKTWNVYGQANLVATGLDVMRFVAGDNIVITTNANSSPQEIRFDASLNSSNVTEGSNLYFTNARVYSNVIELGYITASSLSGYATNNQLTSYALVTDLTTANIVENTNLYFTNSRARASISGGTGVSYNQTTGSISIGQDVGTHNNVTFANVTITGNLLVQGNAVIFESNTLAIIDPLIQVGKNPVGDSLDLGFFGHYIGGSPSIERHAGLFRDASDGQFKLFTNLDPEPTNTVDTGNASYQSANIVVNYVVGKVSDISNHTTTNLSEGSNLYFTNARVYSNVVQLGYITNNNLSGYATNNQLGLYATNSQLNLYATNSNLVLKANVYDLTTSNVLEIGNLYFTNARVYSNVVQLGYITASSLSGYATNSQLTSYATSSNLALKANITDLTSANVTEVNNLYFTNARVYSNVVQLGYITNTTLNGYATNLQLSVYATNNQLSSYATLSHVSSEVANLVNSAPATLDTLNELAIALGNDASFATTVTNLISQKANTTSLTTANVVELNNLYFTNNRVQIYLEQTGNIIPSGNNIQNLGSPSNKFKSLYLSGNTIYLGDTLLSSRNGKFTIESAAGSGNVVTSNDLTTANVSEVGNLYFTNTRAYANTLSAIKTGNGIIFDNTTGNVTLSVSGVASGTYGNANFVPIITVDTYGRVTNLSSTPVAGGGVALLSGNNISIVDSTINLVSDFGTFTNPTPARFRLRRGLESDRLSFTPLEGELIYATDSKIVYVGDGSTPGGLPIGNTTTITSFDGGGPETLVFSNTLDGGSPSSTYSSTLDGGSPE